MGMGMELYGGGAEGRRYQRGRGRVSVESGTVVVMPGEREGRFEADEGERFQEGEAYYFSVKSRVRKAGGRRGGGGRGKVEYCYEWGERGGSGFGVSGRLLGCVRIHLLDFR